MKAWCSSRRTSCSWKRCGRFPIPAAFCGNVRFLVISKHMRPYNTFQFRIKMREKVGTAEEEPVKEEYIVNLHTIQHCKEPRKEPEKSKIVSYTVPRADNNGSHKQQNGKPLYDPADDMRAGEPLLFIGNGRQIFFRRGRKNLLFWIKPTAPYRMRKYAAIIISVASMVIPILSRPPALCYCHYSI